MTTQSVPHSVPKQTYQLGLGGELAALRGFADYCESCGYSTFILDDSQSFSMLNGVSSRTDPTVQAVLDILLGGFETLCDVAKTRCDA